MDQHVRDDLSAYLDDALAPAERAAVAAHLSGCALCRGAAAELRATAQLIAALPLPVPSRRLVPALAPRYAWLRPLRSLSAVLAGAFIFLFIASATLENPGWGMGGGSPARTSGGATLNAPAAAPAGQPAPAAGPTGAVRNALVAPSPGSVESAARAQPTMSPGVRQDSARGAPTGDAAEAERAAPEPLRIGPTPWLWLALAVLSAALAVAAHRRLRAR